MTPKRVDKDEKKCHIALVALELFGKTCFQTATELAGAIARREVSALEVVDAHLDRIATMNPEINALVTLDGEAARRQAMEADDALNRGQSPGPLHGVPVTFKDVWQTANLPTCAGHPPLAKFVPEQDATVVARLRAAGAIVLGKTNLPELAMDTQCENPLFGITRNPRDPERTCGGSSGGEAAALAAGMTPLGVGSDVGGSVRIPAHFCGVYALKPTFGRIPMTGHIPPHPGTVNFLRHMATPGPMARSVEDLRLCLSVLSGPDGKDPDARWGPSGAGSTGGTGPRPLRDIRFAWTDDFGGLPVCAEAKDGLARLANRLADAGCVVERAMPRNFDLEEVWTVYGEMMGVMLAAHLPLLPRSLMKLLGPLVLRQDPVTRAGASSATAGMGAYFAVLEKQHRLSCALEDFFTRHDVLLCPVSSSYAFRHRKAGKINTPVEVDGKNVPGHLGTIGYTCPFNLTGHPAVVLPLGQTADGLPVGVQLATRLWGDDDLLDIARELDPLIMGFRRFEALYPG